MRTRKATEQDAIAYRALTGRVHASIRAVLDGAPPSDDGWNPLRTGPRYRAHWRFVKYLDQLRALHGFTIAHTGLRVIIQR